jgi:hypothetical protein
MAVLREANRWDGTFYGETLDRPHRAAEQISDFGGLEKLRRGLGSGAHSSEAGIAATVSFVGDGADRETTREERVGAMVAAMMDETPMSEEEVEASFVDMDSSGAAAMYLPSVGESSETEDVAGDELRGDAG